MSSDERADYLMEAFLDEQNTLIRPLVSRKLHLVKVLDERSAVIERLVEEKRKKLLSSPRGGGARGSMVSIDDLRIIEQLEDELEQLANEKVTVCSQLMDLVKRPFETILEVEAALRIATEQRGSTMGNSEETAVVSTVTTTRAPQIGRAHV